jgi:hypothetical protein
VRPPIGSAHAALHRQNRHQVRVETAQLVCRRFHAELVAAVQTERVARELEEHAGLEVLLPAGNAAHVARLVRLLRIGQRQLRDDHLADALRLGAELVRQTQQRHSALDRRRR